MKGVYHMIFGAVAYGVGTFLTLQSGMATFESTCHTVDGLIDRFIDIKTISPIFMHGGYAKVTLRSKSERQVYYAFEDIVFRLCTEFPGAEPYGPYSREGIKRAIEFENSMHFEIVNSVFTHVCRIGTGDISWISTALDQELHMWVQDRISLEDRQVIADAMVLMADLAEDGRLE